MLFRSVPKALIGKEKNPLQPGLHGAGFHTKYGIMYGFSRNGKDYTEEVIIEFSRKPLQEDTDKELVNTLDAYWKLKLKQGYKPYNDDVTVKKGKFVKKRLITWFKGLGLYFNSVK